MFAAAATVFLAVSLVLEAAVRSQVTLGRAFMVAGLAFLVLAILAPSWSLRRHPRHPWRCHVSETPQHPAVTHAVHLRKQQHLEQMGAGLLGTVRRADDTALTGLSRVFGWPATVWLFFALPLIARFLGAKFQTQFFYYSSGWIQLFALPLLTYIGVKLQRSSDAQSEVQHAAMVHIATVEDQNKTLIEQNTELTTQVHALVAALPKPPAQKTLARKPVKEAGA